MADHRVDPLDQNIRAIGRAFDNNHTKVVIYIEQPDIIDILLKKSKVDASLTYSEKIVLLKVACMRGHLNLIDKLLTDLKVDPTSDGYFIVSLSYINNHTHVLKRLLQDSRIKKSAKDYYHVNLSIWCWRPFGYS